MHTEQTKAIRTLVSRGDLLAVLPNGFGKSLIFQVLVRVKEILMGKTLVVIVVCPLQSTRFPHERTTSNIHKIFHSPILFFNYEMILRTFNCTIVNQIKSSKKLEVKLKIRICSYYR